MIPNLNYDRTLSEASVSPVAPSQRGIWISSTRDPDRDPYVVVDISTVRGCFDMGVLRKAVASIVRKHPALRMSFPNAEEPVQVLHEHVTTFVDLVDLTDHADGRAEALRLAELHALAAFDLTAPPLLRVSVFRTGSEESILSISIHHLVCDEGSLSFIHQDLQAEYAAQLTGTTTPDSNGDYLEYARRQNQRLESGPGRRSRAYWEKVFKNLPHELDLRADFSRSVPPSHQGHVASWTLTRKESLLFESTAKSFRVTPFILMTTLFSLVLARHCEQDEFALGAVISTRDAGEDGNTVGHFAHLLPIPIRLRRDATLADAVRCVQHGFFGTIDHQDITLDQIVSFVGGTQTRHRMPLCQAYVGWSEGSGSSWKLGTAIVEPMTRDSGSAKAELLFSGSRQGEHLKFELIGEASLFKAETVQLLVEHVRSLFRWLTSNETAQSAFGAELADAAERERLVGWSLTDVREGARTTIQLVFRGVAQAYPDNIAVDGHDSALTYSQLDAQSDRWAQIFADVGVTTDSIVGIAVPRSATTIAIVLGVLKAGGAYLPISHDGPAEYNRDCLEQCHAVAVVTLPGKEASFRDFMGAVLCTDSISAEHSATVAMRRAPRSNGMHNSVALICQTSGSTGAPKSVGLTHENILRVVFRSSRLKHGPDTTFAQFASQSFDISALEIWTCLLHGGRLLVPGEFKLDVNELVVKLRAGKVTSLVTTTAVFTQLVEHGLESLDRLEQIIVGGERAVPSVFDDARRAAGDFLEILHCYGPTENTCISTSARIDGEIGSAVSIGTPIEGSTAYVLDPISLELVPIGISGELFTGGQGVSRGYLNDSSRTAERFLPDPHSSEPGARMYRTGDAVRWTADGQLEFIGRFDRQLKIRGYRIEPGHVEAALLAHPRVQGAAVTMYERVDGHRQLVAYVVSPEFTLDMTEARTFMSGKLPDYMIPTSLTRIESLPLTANGKIDYKSLPTPSGEAYESSKDEEFSPMEQLVAECWESILGQVGIGRTDDFFVVGGDSLLSIRVAARLRGAGADIVSADLYTAPTIASLAELLDDRARKATGELERIRPQATAQTESGQMSPIAHWFLEKFGAETHFNQSVRLTSQEQLDESLFLDAFDAVIAHHPMLRMSVTAGKQGWAQNEIEPVLDLLEVVEFGGTEVERLAAISNEAERLQSSIDLCSGRLIAGLLILNVSGPDDVVIVAHHWGVDTVSWDVIMRHLEIAYRQLQLGRTPDLPQPSRSMESWNDELSRKARSATFDEIAIRWQQIDRNRPTTSVLHSDLDPGTTRTAGTVTATLDSVNTEALMRGTREAWSVDTRSVLLTALARALAAWTDGTHWTVDLEGHGRDALGASVDMSEYVGWFTALYPVSISVDMDTSVEEQVMSMEAELGGQPPGCTFGMAKYLRDDWPLDRSLRSDLVFNYQGRVGSDDTSLLRALGGGYGGDIGDDIARPHAIEINAIVRDGSLHVRLTYPGNSLGRDEFQLLVDNYIEQCAFIAQPFLLGGEINA